ncbi:MAG TPA: hypothetical protein PLA88_10220 [Bacteroidales bacterium]|nr:hypothetical protein [Bacteroidales bacterium]
MKTSEFDNMIRQALLEEAANDDATAEAARGRVWQKANPPKMFSFPAMLFRVAAAAIIVLLLTTTYFMWIQNDKSGEQMAERKEMKFVTKRNSSSVEPAQKVILQTIYRDRYVASAVVHDTVETQKEDIVYTIIHDTVFIERQNTAESLIAGGNPVDYNIFPIENTPQKQIRGILFWRTKTAFSNNTARADVRRDRKKQPFLIPVISAQ